MVAPFAPLAPAGVATVTVTAPPPGWAGAVAVMLVPLLTVNGALWAPKVTTVAPTKPVPVMTTESPPAAEPTLGDRLVTVGATAAGVQVTRACSVAPAPLLQP